MKPQHFRRESPRCCLPPSPGLLASCLWISVCSGTDTPHLLFSQPAQSYPPCSRYVFCLLPLCCPANCCSVNSSLTAFAVPSLLLQGPLTPHPEAFTEEGGRSMWSHTRGGSPSLAPCGLFSFFFYCFFSSHYKIPAICSQLLHSAAQNLDTIP